MGRAEGTGRFPRHPLRRQFSGAGQYWILASACFDGIADCCDYFLDLLSTGRSRRLDRRSHTSCCRPGLRGRFVVPRHSPIRFHFRKSTDREPVYGCGFHFLFSLRAVAAQTPLQCVSQGAAHVNEAISRALDPLLAGQDLSRAQTQDAFAVVMDGLATDAEIAALLTAFRIKGETVEEISGAAEAMSARATLIPCSHRDLLDTCGTGGDNLHTFNISTATALVAAACGVPVAKHGNRSVSSSSGSADVLEALGVNIQRTPEQTARCIEEVGIGFCFAQLVHGAMKHVAPVRKQLGFRTIFKLLGPLTNPANARYQLVGGNTLATAEKLAGALAELGRHRAVVVCGNGELDEVS
ncbi:MAG: anthranilate phosphoribosyltransferase, partial [Planctomycetes bacterium]|nr:anthranilate phosphoribosyltransferase [Planctomycetota bacterium]